jgi:hypothetical protein
VKTPNQKISKAHIELFCAQDLLLRAADQTQHFAHKAKLHDLAAQVESILTDLEAMRVARDGKCSVCQKKKATEEGAEGDLYCPNCWWAATRKQ